MTITPTLVNTTITPCPGGPLLVRGEFVLAGEEDGQWKRPRPNVVALCRCGASGIPPLCDGSRNLIGSHAPGAASKVLPARLPDNTDQTPRPAVG
ncbi:MULTISPECIES: CDGSH iron-sulfur domain-containing protein [Brevibacterium]|uniref:Iron-binding zinc finger CDGSH type domain-containing protein n=1 Tax=Brevibacterium luteolum TaxID=199591 RepID=A0A2N6PJQ6_9MICO|nr:MULTISPECIES: CDGSH iron-sulfur domain-containing protein [Brevibacterium]MCT1658310.1 CDGSH iron-sulfur domain-containing protein [Brevibacterium luteolum]MCT1830702.1 CDGSH iron-sulfur domain-containing protein [Brevibacterium luteolum]MCT1873006.1 CDGSH iron-sulfur domain-containing protein [Brevibacterium luteolum]MCT1890700.1 CDGSH iron-sulfur domain-containing protein [Brevibacterium luteolum]MCT1892878.1 CDGSH iron-sulfur domain-containing protein [Brevibacterium luteolum]